MGAQTQRCFGATPTIVAVAGVPTVGTEGPDVILGTTGPDDISGGGGADRICARGGPDLVRGGGGADRVDLGSGNDQAFGGSGPDLVRGKAGRDLIRGQGGRDRLVGGGGADELSGGRQADELYGRVGDDLLRGGSGADLLSGAGGRDGCVSGNGRDTFAGCTETRARRFRTRPPGADLPSDAQCAAMVRSADEVRPANRKANRTRGTNRADDFPRVTGNFAGTTDEILQWVACKHGIDEDLVRAQIAVESWWRHSTPGDLTTDQSLCHPDVRGGVRCPESVGLGQVRFQFHTPAFEDSNAIRSAAYNLDYTYEYWRRCFEGEFTWLNGVERGRTYRPGDALGCAGVWFAGRWYAAGAQGYMDLVQQYVDTRIWETPNFIAG